MTEEEWMTTTDWGHMHDCLQEHGIDSERKFRLLACAHCRRIWSLLTDSRCRDAVEAAERVAEGITDTSTLIPYYEAARQGCEELTANREWPFSRELVRRVFAYWHVLWAARNGTGDPGYCARLQLAAMNANPQGLNEWTSDLQFENDVALMREIFGNPFRSASLDPSWLSSTVGALAQSIYNDRAFDRLPILADALEEAGCTSPEILAHCRGPGPHVRGCWVVDLVLGKE
jgi:hypothetical protein